MTVALTSCNSLPSFPFCPHATFQLFKKLDVAFCSLLRGVFLDTGHQLPGFEGGRGTPSTTEQVRLRGIVQRTRVAVVEVAGKGDAATDYESTVGSGVEETTDDDDDMTIDGTNADTGHADREMEVARVYEQTVVELGQSLQSENGN